MAYWVGRMRIEGLEARLVEHSYFLAVGPQEFWYKNPVLATRGDAEVPAAWTVVNLTITGIIRKFHIGSESSGNYVRKVSRKGAKTQSQITRFCTF